MSDWEEEQINMIANTLDLSGGWGHAPAHKQIATLLWKAMWRIDKLEARIEQLEGKDRLR